MVTRIKTLAATMGLIGAGLLAGCAAGGYDTYGYGGTYPYTAPPAYSTYPGYAPAPYFDGAFTDWYGYNGPGWYGGFLPFGVYGDGFYRAGHFGGGRYGGNFGGGHGGGFSGGHSGGGGGHGGGGHR